MSDIHVAAADFLEFIYERKKTFLCEKKDKSALLKYFACLLLVIELMLKVCNIKVLL